MPRYQHDVAISAVSFDAMVVADVSGFLESRLGTSVAWSGGVARSVGEAAAPLLGDASRVALVLHQRLWGGGRDDTQADVAALRARAGAHPGSVIVVSLDDAPLPDWLAEAPTCHLPTAGLDGVVQFVFEAIAGAGGTLGGPARSLGAAPTPSGEKPFRNEGSARFLSQLRAHSALRRELDAIGEELESRLCDSELLPDHTAELTILPHRFTARLDEVGLTFSWVPGRTGTVEDGRLLVIEWRGVVRARRGPDAFRSATPIRERIYQAEATDPASWRWRDDTPNGRACSTANLVGDAVAFAWVESTETRASAAS